MHGLNLPLICTCDYCYPNSPHGEMETEWKSEFATFAQDFVG